MRTVLFDDAVDAVAATDDFWEGASPTSAVLMIEGDLSTGFFPDDVDDLDGVTGGVNGAAAAFGTTVVLDFPVFDLTRAGLPVPLQVLSTPLALLPRGLVPPAGEDIRLNC